MQRLRDDLGRPAKATDSRGDKGGPISLLPRLPAPGFVEPIELSGPVFALPSVARGGREIPSPFPRRSPQAPLIDEHDRPRDLA